MSDPLMAIRRALDCASDLAGAQLARDKEAYRGYPNRLKPAERDVADVAAGFDALDTLQAQVEQLRTEAKVASDRIQELGRFAKAQTREIEGLRADLSRAECNRDMWEEQCARQAEQLETGILRLNAEQAKAEGLMAVRVALDRLVAHIGMDGEIDANHPAVHEALDALIAIDSARAGREDGNG